MLAFAGKQFCVIETVIVNGFWDQHVLPTRIKCVVLYITVWFFILKSTDGDHRLVDYNERHQRFISNFRILCLHSLCPPAVWYESLSWFADMTFTELD